LRRQLADERREREAERNRDSQKIASLEFQVNVLTRQLNETTQQLGVVKEQSNQLRAENERLKAQLPRLKERMPDTPLLHICGDTEFCRQDQIQLRRARVPFRALENATRRDVEDEVQRQREN